MLTKNLNYSQGRTEMGGVGDVEVVIVDTAGRFANPMMN